MHSSKPPKLVVIVGETASGKSAVALELAERLDGEIIAADSRTVYMGMNIGTAKPTVQDQARVRHHLLDITTPNKPITVADFKRLAEQAITDIASRGKLPIMVGGTGLYIDAVLYDYAFRPPADPAARAELQKLSVNELQERIAAAGFSLPENSQNPRHLIRVLETEGAASERRPLRQQTLVLGTQLGRDELNARIAWRVGAMVAAGLQGEAEVLAAIYGWDIPAMQTIGYQEWQAYLNGSADLEATKRLIISNTRAYAKRQRTWFKRNSSVQYIGQQAKAVDITTTFLSN